MKRLLTLTLCIILLTGITAGCGKNDTTGSNEDNSIITSNPNTALKIDKELSDIVDNIYQHKQVDLGVTTNAVNINDENALKAYTGLDSADKIKSAVFSEPEISSYAYSLVLIKLKNADDAQSVANDVKNGINPGKWICNFADDLQVAACDNIVMLIMTEEAISETVTADEIVTAFKNACGQNLSVELK